MAAAAAAPSLAWAQPVKTVALKEALHFLDLYLELPPAQRTRFYLAYRATRGGRPAPDAEALIVAPGGAHLPLPLDREGQVTRLPTLAQLKTCSLEMIGPPFQFGLEMRAVAPLATRIDPAELALALTQLNAGIAKSGSLAFLAPKMTAAYFIDAEDGRAVLGDGRSAALPVFHQHALGAVPYFEPSALAGARALVFARPPSRILLGDKPGWGMARA
ncbi:MAG: hypothetical protein ACREEW_08765 [Caulobacteraceae bacterium]